MWCAPGLLATASGALFCLREYYTQYILYCQ
nr:MAG TPA: hypothetical protein [Caudoviricetes sp.]